MLLELFYAYITEFRTSNFGTIELLFRIVGRFYLRNHWKYANVRAKINIGYY